MTVRVRDLRQEDRSGSFDVVASVSIDGETRPMRFSRYGNHPGLRQREETYDPFLVALLVPAMLRKEPLVIEGPVDELLLYNLRGPVQDTIRVMAPELPVVPVEAAASPSRNSDKVDRGMAVGFSGGVDSMHVVHHHLFGKGIPDPLRLRLLIHNHVGSHDENDALFRERFAGVQKLADRFELPLVGAQCHMNELYMGTRFNEYHTLRTVAAAISLDHLFDRYFFASAEELGRKVARTRFSGISTLEPQLLPLFNTARVQWTAFGGSATRLRKTFEVLNDDRLCDGIQVCVRGDGKSRNALNCGRCHKCARLLMQAEVMGRLERVAPTFDLDAYWAGRNYSIFRMLRLALKWRASRNDVNLLKYLAGHAFKFPAWARPLVGVALLRHGRDIPQVEVFPEAG